MSSRNAHPAHLHSVGLSPHVCRARAWSQTCGGHLSQISRGLCELGGLRRRPSVKVNFSRGALRGLLAALWLSALIVRMKAKEPGQLPSKKGVAESHRVSAAFPTVDDSAEG